MDERDARVSCDGPSLRSAIAQHHANAILRLEKMLKLRGTLFLRLGLRIVLVRSAQLDYILMTIE